MTLSNELQPAQERQGHTAAVGCVIGAVLASSCCIGPLVLITLGASGAWIGNLASLKAYQPIFVVVTLVFLGLDAELTSPVEIGPASTEVGFPASVREGT